MTQGRPPAEPASAGLARFRPPFAEMLGTFCLTFVAAGGGAIAAVTGGGLGESAAVISHGLLVTAMIYTVGPISGAHLNPTVTLAFAVRRNFPWERVPGYWGAQLLGAVLGALTLGALVGPSLAAGVTHPREGPLQALAMESFLTFLLVTVILATAAHYRIVGHNAAFAVGATIILDGLFAAPLTGASMNPARSFGPALVTGQLHDLWIYVVGPFLGSFLAIGVAWLLRGPGSPYATRVAMGLVPPTEETGEADQLESP